MEAPTVPLEAPQSNESAGLTPGHFMLLMLVNLLWGSNIVASKFAVNEFPPMLATMLRFVILFVVCAPWLRILPGRMPMVIGFGLLFGVVHFSLIFTALDMAEDAGVVAIVSQLGVPFSLLLAIIFLRERIGWRRSLGIFLAFGGVMVIGFDPRVFDYLGAVVLGSLAAFIYAITTLMMRQIRGVEPLQLQAWIAAVSILPLLGLSLLSGDDVWALVQHASWRAWAGVTFSATMSSAIAHASMFFLLQRYPVSTIMPFSLLSPVIAVAAGIMVLGDTLTPLMVGGGLLTFVGVIIITLRGVGLRAPKRPAL